VSVSECSMSDEFPSQESSRLGAPRNRDRPRRAAGLGWSWRSRSPSGGPVRALRPQAKAVRCAMTDSTAPLAQLLAHLAMGDASVDRGHSVGNCTPNGPMRTDAHPKPLGERPPDHRIRRMCTDCTSPNMAKNTMMPEPP
jgi:hypothetical protein